MHYLQPGGSSLLSRGVFTLEEVRSAGLKRTDQKTYEEQLQSKYIVGVQEDRPAVIRVNMQIASMAINLKKAVDRHQRPLFRDRIEGKFAEILEDSSQHSAPFRLWA